MPLDQTLEWWEKRANRGETEALLRLAEAYDQGNGVEKNFQKATFYYTIAADQGDQAAETWMKQNVPNYKNREERRAEREREKREREARTEMERAEKDRKSRRELFDAMDENGLPESNRFLRVHDGIVREETISRREISAGLDVASLALSIPVFQKVAKDEFLSRAQGLGIIAVRVHSPETLYFSDDSTLLGILIREGDYTYTRRDSITVTVPLYVLVMGRNK